MLTFLPQINRSVSTLKTLNREVPALNQDHSKPVMQNGSGTCFDGSLRNLKTMQMSKKANHNADIKNPNKGTDGTNKTYDQNQGNRGKQMNPNQKGKK
jgi:hypothetical protein